MLKRLLKACYLNPTIQNLLAGLLAGYVRLVVLTSKVTFEGQHIAEDLHKRKQSYILATWHGRILVTAAAPRALRTPPPLPIHALISPHGDGAMLAAVLRKFHCHVIFGSSNRHGHEAYQSILELLQSSPAIIVITPDGPRGPRMRVKPGIIRMAQESRLPLVPFSNCARRVLRLKSWDRFLLVLPFNHIVYRMGTPLFLEGDHATLPAQAQELEQAMTALQDEVDQKMGQPPTEPGAPSPWLAPS